MNRDAMPVKGLDQLINRIRAEAIEEADRRAADILSGAEHEAGRIVEEAKLHAREITVSAEKEIEKSRDVATKALRRAARDAVIETRQLILRLFAEVLQTETRAVLSGESLASFISTFISRLSESAVDADLSVRLGGPDSDRLIEAIRVHLGTVTGDGLELKTDPDLAAGFRIGFRDGNFFYEVSPETVSEILMRHLSPELNRLMDGREET